MIGVSRETESSWDTEGKQMGNREFMRVLCRGLCWIALPAAAYAADMDKLLTGNMEGYGGDPVPTVDITAQGKDADQALAMVYGGLFTDVRAAVWKPGEAVDAVIDLRAQRVIKTVHVRFGGDASALELSYSADRQSWRPMETAVTTYPRNVTWFEAVDYAAPARYLRLGRPAGGEALSIRETRIYGADRIEQVDLVDGVYATSAPAVAGTAAGLNVIIANTGPDALANLTVQVNQADPDPRPLGREQAEMLAQHRSMMFTVPWNPAQTEPHRIAVAVQWRGLEHPVESTVTLPVVNRRLWFASAFRWATFEGPTHINLFTPYTEENDPGQIRLARRRGGRYLRGCSTAHIGGVTDPEVLADGFVRAMDLSDGISINEYTRSKPAYIAVDVEALPRARQARPDKTIAPWTTGTAYALELFQTTADVVLMESYMTIYGPKVYEMRFGRQIDSLREYGLADRAILVQGIFGDKHRPMTPEDLENSIRFVRHYAPELPGMGCYGGWLRGPTAEHYCLCDDLCYQYFIAPVVTPAGAPVREGDRLDVTLRNVGGMNAHDVRVAAVEAETGRELGRSAPVDIPAEGTATATVRLPDAAQKLEPGIRILPSDGYTALQYVSALDLHRRHRTEAGGIPVQRVGYLGNDPEGVAPVPDEAWECEDETPADGRDDYQTLVLRRQNPSVVLDLGAAPPRPVTRIRCRGYWRFGEEDHAGFLPGLRVLESNDNVTYKPIAEGYEARWDSNVLLFWIEGLRTRARYLKIHCTYQHEGKGAYWIPRLPDDLDPYYKAGDGGLIGWDAYLED